MEEEDSISDDDIRWLGVGFKDVNLRVAAAVTAEDVGGEHKGEVSGAKEEEEEEEDDVDERPFMLAIVPVEGRYIYKTKQLSPTRETVRSREKNREQIKSRYRE